MQGQRSFCALFERNLQVVSNTLFLRRKEILLLISIYQKRYDVILLQQLFFCGQLRSINIYDNSWQLCAMGAKYNQIRPFFMNIIIFYLSALSELYFQL